MPENNNIMSIEGQLIGMPLAGPESFSQQQLDYLKRALGVDETVLWESTPSASSITLTETAEHFERIKIFYRINDLIYGSTEAIVMGGSQNIGMSVGGNYGTQFIAKWGIYYLNGTSLGPTQTKNAMEFNTNSVGGTVSVQYESVNAFYILKVVGIHRVAGGN